MTISEFAEMSEILTTEETRTIIKFQTLLGNTSNDILKDFVTVLGAENAPGRSKTTEPIRGVRFQTSENIHVAVSEQLKTLQKKGLDGGVPGLPHRWNSCVEALGDYFEGII